jgi:hypothetical protein
MESVLRKKSVAAAGRGSVLLLLFCFFVFCGNRGECDVLPSTGLQQAMPSDCQV